MRAMSSRRSSALILLRLSAIAVFAASSLSSAIMARVFSSCALHWHVDSVTRQNALRVESALAMESSRAFASATVSTGAFAESGCAAGALAFAACAALRESAGVMVAGSFLFLPAQSSQRSVHSIDIGGIGKKLLRRVSESTVAFAALMALGWKLFALCSASPALERSSNLVSVVRPFSMFL